MPQRGISRATIDQRRNAERVFLRDKIAKIDGLTDEERLELEDMVWNVAKNPKECRKIGLAPKESYFDRINYSFQEETIRLVVILTYIRTCELEYR